MSQSDAVALIASYKDQPPKLIGPKGATDYVPPNTVTQQTDPTGNPIKQDNVETTAFGDKFTFEDTEQEIANLEYSKTPVADAIEKAVAAEQARAADAQSIINEFNDQVDISLAQNKALLQVLSRIRKATSTELKTLSYVFFMLLSLMLWMYGIECTTVVSAVWSCFASLFLGFIAGRLYFLTMRARYVGLVEDQGGQQDA